MAIVSESLDGGFLGADLHSIREPIEALPWVYRVVVRRRWPDSLEIRVTEQRAIARWGEDAYLNHAGEVFHPGIPGPMEELPLLAGPDRSQVEVMQYYKLVQDYLQTLGLQVEQLSMDRRGGLSVQLTGGSRLVFGRGETRAKLRRFAQVYEQHLAPRAEFLSSVDLRYSHGVAVAWAKTQPPGKKNKT